jgi:hypothetical protein
MNASNILSGVPHLVVVDPRPARVGAVENQSLDAAWVQGSQQGAQGPAILDTEQRGAIPARMVERGEDVDDPDLQRQRAVGGNHALGEPSTAQVDGHDLGVFTETREEARVAGICHM